MTTFWSLSPNFWGLESAVLQVLALGLISLWLSRRLHWLIGLNFFWMAFSAFRVCIFPTSPWAAEPAQWAVAFDSAASLAALQLFLYAAVSLLIPLQTWQKFFQVVAWINIALLIPPPHYGILVNASMSGCFAAALLPFTWGPWWLAILSAVAILSSGQSQPIAGLFIFLFLWALKQKRYFDAAVMPVLALAIGYWVNREQLFFSTGRTEVWRLSLEWWSAHSNFVVGAGSGSYSVIGPYLTEHLGAIFVWLHSDWLQILLEQGVIGLALIGSLVGLLLWRSKGSIYFILVALYAAWSLANMPLRYPLSALYGLFVLRLALRD